MQDLNSKELRKVFGHYPTGVTIVTSADTAGNPVGMTANSFASVSLSPPLVLWSVDSGGNAHDIYTQATHFCVHVLSEQQQDLSDRFSSMQGDRFEGIDWECGELGSPLLPEYLCRIQCSNEAVYPGGDHSIILGKVVNIELQEQKRPLLFHQGSYQRL